MKWLLNDPAIVPKGKLVLVRVETPYNLKYIAIGFVNEAGIWRTEKNRSFASLDVTVTGWMPLPSVED